MSMKSYESVLVGIPEYRWIKRLMMYVPPVLLVLGTLGNAFSFLILRRRAMRKVSSYHYLACLALADSLVLYIGLFRLWLAEITDSDFHDSRDWACKLTVSLGYAASDLSVWLIIAVTVERYIVVCFPLRASSMITTARAKKVIGFLMLLMLTLNLHFFWTVRIVDRPFDGRNVSNCEAAPFHEGLVNDVWPWVDACIYSFVPFIAILVLNIFIIIEVIEARNHRQRMQTRSDNAPSPSARSGHYQDDHAPGDRRRLFRRSSRPGEGTKLTIMLLSVSFTFLLTTLPMNVALIVTAFWQPQSTLRQVARFKLVRTVAELLMYVNHSVNFFLYCATGHKFRQQIVHMLTCRTQSPQTPWSSMHTEDTKMLQASVRNGHHPRTSPHRRLLLANVANDDDEVYGLNGETIPLRAV